MKQTRTGLDLSYTSIFWLFMLGSILGYLLEGFWCILTKGHWEHHAATLWGHSASYMALLPSSSTSRPITFKNNAYGSNWDC